jgi:hypothetical protein
MERQLVKADPKLTNLRRVGVEANEVLVHLYNDCSKWGEIMWGVWEWTSDYTKPEGSRSRYREHDCIIVRIDGKQDSIFLHGTSTEQTCLAVGAGEILMFGNMNWDAVLKDTAPVPWTKDLSWPKDLNLRGAEGLPPKEAVNALTDSQIKRILSHRDSSTLDPAQLIMFNAYTDEVGIRNGYFSNGISYLDQFISKPKASSRYGEEIVTYLAEHIRRKISITC